MWKVVLFIASGLILLGSAGLYLFPDIRADILQRLPFWGSGALSREVTLTYWGLWEPRSVIQPLLDEYQQQNPHVTIEYEMREPADYYNTVQARLGSEGAPDIIRIHASWVPIWQKYLAPLPKEILTTAQYEEIFYPVNQIFLKQGGVYYAIPLMIDGLALVYNRQLFAEEGIVVAPKTWIEFQDGATRLTKKNSQGQIVQAGAALGFAENVDYAADIIGLMLAQNGVQFVNPQGQVVFHQMLSQVGDNLGQEVLDFYAKFARTNPSWDSNWSNSTQEFANGRVGMIFIPHHRLLEILAAAPDFEIGVAPVPQLPVVNEESQIVTWANYWVEAVVKTSSNPQEAWKFLKWMSEKEQLTQFYRQASQVRAFGEPYPRKDLASSLSTEIYTSPYVQQAANYTTWYFTSNTFNPVVNEKIVGVLENAISAIANGHNSIDQLNFVAQQTQQILDAVLKPQ